MLRDETIRRVIQFRDDREWRQFHTPKDLAISLSLEAAELLEIFQWSGADLECRDKLGRIRGGAGGCAELLRPDGRCVRPDGDIGPCMGAWKLRHTPCRGGSGPRSALRISRWRF